MVIDPAVGKSKTVLTMVEFTDGKDGVDFVITGLATVEEGACPVNDDGVHCEHWWDGGSCCSCGALGMTTGSVNSDGDGDAVAPGPMAKQGLRDVRGHARRLLPRPSRLWDL